MKKYLLSSILIIAGIGCGVVYNIIGSEVASDGTLVEPFFLIPMSYLFIALGILVGLVVTIVSFLRSNK